MKKAEIEHKAALISLGCLACLRIHGPHAPGHTELHHFRGGGWGRGDYTTLIPLCIEHHRGDTGLHGLGTKGFDTKYAKSHGFTQRDLLEDARAMTGWVAA